MKLAFEERYYPRDPVDPAIKELEVIYEPETIQDVYNYIRNRASVRYYNVNFDNNMDVLVIDYGSHSGFFYLWDLNEDQKREFCTPRESYIDDEEVNKKRFAAQILYKIKQMNTIPYDVAVAFNKILGEQN